MDFVVDSGLALYLPLHQLDGTSFMSGDRNGHVCTATGAMWTPQGRSFDGVDDVIAAALHSGLDITTLTVAVWARMDDVSGADYHPLVSKGNPIAVGGCWSLMARGDILSFFFVRLGDDSNYAAIRFPTPTKGAWFHVAGIITSDSLSTYWNGDLNQSDALSAPIFPNSTQAVVVGKVGAYPPILGPIGEVWIYNRALTPVEIQRLYLATKWRYR